MAKLKNNISNHVADNSNLVTIEKVKIRPSQ
jgi:hypothetical protein